ncbi:hypothetical protein WISP_18103 [Willisornis vidua]|uniref:Rna-directed dna polymerase from mobile element jockey-like n=1 Tax=Willisornis vidua TaxID=1566151 RepID=A0ABQ9DP51_9PASS|nr:hypothetical protein WISP_18103 [Willisornis vidua]
MLSNSFEFAVFLPCGTIEVHPRILKELADVIIKPLSMIFEQSWESREVPADWKLVNGVTIFKNSKKEYPGNYRPVSLTSVSGKVVERIIHDRKRDLDKLEKWACGNVMRFNKIKCKVLHMAQGNPLYQYKLEDEQMESSPAKKDLGWMRGWT